MKKYILSLIKHLSIIVSICCMSYVFIIIIFIALYHPSLSEIVDDLMYSEPVKRLTSLLSLGLILLFYLRKTRKK